MKYLTALILVFILACSVPFGVSAQVAPTIWLETSKDSYSAGEVITFKLHTNATASFQGLTFQLRYDPVCLQPASQTSLIPGLNAMSIPQTAGLVDGIFASTTPLTANGPLVEVNFNAVAACQTTIVMESAILVVSDSSGLAVPMPGLIPGTGSLVLNVGGAQGAVTQPTSVPDTIPTTSPDSNPAGEPGTGEAPATKPLGWLTVVLLGLLSVLLFFVLIVAGRFLMSLSQNQPAAAAVAKATPSIYIQRGSQAGRTLPLLVFPCRIGSDPDNEVCLNDSRIAAVHARIIASPQGFFLVDLGSKEGTYLNGRLIHNQQVLLKQGDVLRLGGVLLVFSPS